MPTFRYHPDPLVTVPLRKGSLRPALRVGEDHTIYYALRHYCVEELRHLCPTCILLVVLPKKFEAEFIQDADWQGVMDKEKTRFSSVKLQSIVAGRANIGSLVAKTTVPIWGQLALVNWKKWALLSKS